MTADAGVVLTFDDGYRSVYETAYPLLKARGWPFTVFLCPEGIDRGRGPVMTWDQLREMAAAGCGARRPTRWGSAAPSAGCPHWGSTR